jgi:NADH-quinone oxidoreductase subunit C
MPDEEKPAGEPVSSDQKPAAPESQPPAAAKPPAEAKPGEGGAKTPPPKAEGAKPVEKPAAKPGEKPAAKAEGEKHAAKPPAGMVTTPWEGPLVDRLRQRFGEEITGFHSYLGDPFLVATLPGVFAILQYLKAEEGFDYLVDVTAVHYPQKPKPFEVFWILYSHPHNVRIRVKAEVAEGESPRSADSLYASANWLEREVFDMFGIRFAEHPNMTRILLPDEWVGHPLRKDYSIIQQDQDWVRENLNIESAQ